MRQRLAVLLAALALAGCSKNDETSLPKSEPCADVKESIRLIRQFEETSSSGRCAKILDVSAMSAADFRAELESMPGREVHVWMPGATTWLLVGCLTTNCVSLSSAMNRFAEDPQCARSIAEVFASYVGTREDVLPAFASELKGNVLPEWFVPKELPDLGWIETHGVEPEILDRFVGDVCSAMETRREILRGNVLAAQARDGKGEKAAIECWAHAAERNPGDPLLRERIENLNRNAKGFLEVGKIVQALKCCETAALIVPTDPVAVHNFGACLMRLGRRDIAEKVLARAKELQNMVK